MDCAENLCTAVILLYGTNIIHQNRYVFIPATHTFRHSICDHPSSIEAEVTDIEFGLALFSESAGYCLQSTETSMCLS